MRYFLRSQRGLSLLEAVIALAITGIVIGLLWIVVAPIAQRQKINTNVADIIGLTGKVRSLYGDQQIISTDIKQQLLDANSVPTSLLQLNAAGTPSGIVHSLGAVKNTQIVTVGKAAGLCPTAAGAVDKSDFQMDLANVGKSYCGDFVRALAGTRNTAAHNRLTHVFVNSIDVMANQAANTVKAVDSSLADQNCNTAATVPILLCFAK